MGAWGTGNFANDTANDWADDFVEVGDLSFVRQVLEKVAATTAEEDLREPLSCHALVACEVIARLKGNWGARDSFSKKVDDWVQANPSEPSPDLVQLADLCERLKRCDGHLVHRSDINHQPLTTTQRRIMARTIQSVKVKFNPLSAIARHKFVGVG